MLKNVYLLAKIGADTAENERNCAENLPHISTTNLVITLRVGMPARAGARAAGEAAAAASGAPGPRLVSLDRLNFRGLNGEDPPNFERLVPCCIVAAFSKQTLNLAGFSEARFCKI